MQIRRAEDRGHSRHGWLDSRHTFSFADYYDPRQMGVSNLRVINDDRVAPGAGFNTHGHRDMEIISYVLEGALEHKDSMGNGSIIRPGDVQRMSAGTGVTHSEFNPSSEQSVHFLQIWLEPNRKGVEPGYAQRHFTEDERRGRLVLLVSPDGRAGSISANQDALLYGALLEPGDTAEHRITDSRRAYVHVARGKLEVNGEILAGGDGAVMDAVGTVTLRGVDQTEVLLFDLS